MSQYPDLTNKRVVITGGASGIGIARATSPDGAAAFVPITPCRLFDTRPDFQVGARSAPLGANDTHSIKGVGAVGECGLPADAVGLVLNVTAVDATQLTFLTFWPTGAEQPNASSLNPSPDAPPTPNAVSMVLVENGQALSLWYAFSEAPAASDFVGKIWYTWYDPTTCEEVGEGSSSVSEAIPNNNC